MKPWQEKMQQFDRWLMQPSGQQLLQLQLPIVQHYLDQFCQTSARQQLLIYHGHHHLQLECNHKHIIRLGATDSMGTDVVAAPFALPFAEQSIDTIILPYMLELTDKISDVMQECYRVLRPQGVIIICGLNANSILRWQNRTVSPFNALKFNNVGDLQRELFLEGYDLLQYDKFSFTGLLSSKPWLETMGQFLWPYLANAYVLAMHKRIETLTVIKPKVTWPKAIQLKNTRLANYIAERQALDKR